MTPPAQARTRHPDQVVVRAGPDDADVLAQLIADAFAGLAVSHWLISDPHARGRLFPGYFKIFTSHALDHGITDTTPARDAVALWLPAGPDDPRQPTGYAARLAAATAPWTSRFLAFDAALDARHPAGTTHHHLAMLAIRPDRQGQGIGTALLRAHHARLDLDPGPARPRNPARP